MPAAPCRLLLLTAAAGALTGSEFLTVFDPTPTPPEIAWRPTVEARGYAEAEDRSAPGALAIDRESLSLSTLAVRTARDEGWLNLRGERIALRGDARLPGGDSPDGRYYSLGLGATWKRRFGTAHLAGISANATLDGQLPADDGLDRGGNLTAFSRLGLGAEGRDGLLLALNYDSDRLIFGSIPVLPLAAWQGQRGPWQLVLGVPFTIVTYRTQDLRVTAVAGPIPALSADHRLAGPWRILGDARWSVLQVRRTERTDEADRLRLSQWEWSGGLRLDLGPRGRCDAVAGLATARRLGEDADDGDARRDGLALDAAPFAAIRVTAAF